MNDECCEIANILRAARHFSSRARFRLRALVVQRPERSLLCAIPRVGLHHQSSITSHSKGQLTGHLAMLCSCAAPRAVELVVYDLPALRHAAHRADA